jgi:hypothetical protein
MTEVTHLLLRNAGAGALQAAMRWLMSCAICSALLPNPFSGARFSLADKSLQFSEQHQLLSFVSGSTLVPSTGYQMLLAQSRDSADDSIPLVESMILDLIVLTKSKKGAYDE